MAESDKPQAEQYTPGTRIMIAGKYYIVDKVVDIGDDGRVTWQDTERRLHTTARIAGGG